MSQSRFSQPIPVNTILGERYKVTNAVIETADGDSILDGKDTVLNRKVSIIVAAKPHNDRLIANARTLVTNSRSQVQVLDLGNTAGRAYLVTSFARADTLLGNLLIDSSALAASSESQEALGEEIFGDEEISDSGFSTTHAFKAAPISISRSLNDSSTPRTMVGSTVADGTDPEIDGYEGENYQDYDDYGYSEDYEDEQRRGGGGVWAVAIAAILLLVVGVAVVFSYLSGMVKDDEGEEVRAAPSTASSSSSASEPASESATPSPTSSETEKAEANLTGNVTRIVSSQPAFMADQDATLAQMVDGDPATQWMSYGFATPNFGGAISQVGLAFELEEKAPVSQITIEQVSGVGGNFTILTNDSPSVDGATEVGSGTLIDATSTVDLDTEQQGEGAQYIIVNFTEAPLLAEPIAGYTYGLRIAEVSVSN